MKIEKTVKIPAKKAVKAKSATTKKVQETVCDFCNASVPDHGSYGWSPSCALCDRDCCKKHNQSDPYDFSDYPSWFCRICIGIKETHESDLEEIESSYQEELDRLEQLMKEQSLESPVS